MCEITCFLYSECWHHKRVLALCGKQEQKRLKKYVESQRRSQTSKRSFFSALFSSLSPPPPPPPSRALSYPSSRFSYIGPKPPKTATQHSCRAGNITYKTTTAPTACPDCVAGRTSCRISGRGSRTTPGPVPPKPVPSRLLSHPSRSHADRSQSGLAHSSERLGENRGRSQQQQQQQQQQHQPLPPPPPPPKLTTPTRGDALPRFVTGARRSPAVYGHAPSVPSPQKCSIDRVGSVGSPRPHAGRRQVAVQQRPPEPASRPATNTGTSPGGSTRGTFPRQQQPQPQRQHENQLQHQHKAWQTLPSQCQPQPLLSAPTLSFPCSPSSKPSIYRRPAMRDGSTASNGRGKNIGIPSEAVATALTQSCPVRPSGPPYHPPLIAGRSDSVYSKVSEQSMWENEGRLAGDPRSVSPPGQSYYERWVSDQPAWGDRSRHGQNAYGQSSYPGRR